MPRRPGGGRARSRTQTQPGCCPLSRSLPGSNHSTTSRHSETQAERDAHRPASNPQEKAWEPLLGPQEASAASFLLANQARSCDQSCQQKRENKRLKHPPPPPHKALWENPCGNRAPAGKTRGGTVVLEPRSSPIPSLPSHRAPLASVWRPRAPSPELSPSRQDSRWNVKGSDLATLSPPSATIASHLSRPLLCGRSVVANEPGPDRPEAHVRLGERRFPGLCMRGITPGPTKAPAGDFEPGAVPNS